MYSDSVFVYLPTYQYPLPRSIDMTATTAYCTSGTTFHQRSLATHRPQYNAVVCRTSATALSSSPSSTSVVSSFLIEPSSPAADTKNDENNNHRQNDETDTVDLYDVLYITSDDDDDDDSASEIDPTPESIVQEQHLSLIGLRHKSNKPSAPIRTLVPLNKRLAAPVCLLPLPKHMDRVRRALYLRLPFLKSLASTRDIDSFCSTDETARSQSLLPRSGTQAAVLKMLKSGTRRHKLSKTGNYDQTLQAFVDHAHSYGAESILGSTRAIFALDCLSSRLCKLNSTLRHFCRSTRKQRTLSLCTSALI